MIHKIEISFPVRIEFPEGFERKLHDLIQNEICRKYRDKHPDRTMWVAGYGCKMLTNPYMVSDGEKIEWDDDVYFMEISERARKRRNGK